VDVGSVADILEIHTASIFKIKVNMMMSFCVHIGFSFKISTERKWGWVPPPSQQGQWTEKVVNWPS
jgi:hypothetical protein